MMQQSGIEELRPGPNGNPPAPDRANYDTLNAGPCPKLPNVSLEAHSGLLHFLQQNEKDIWIAPMIDAAKFIKSKNENLLVYCCLLFST